MIRRIMSMALRARSAVLAGVLAACATGAAPVAEAPAPEGSWRQIDHGVLVTPAAGDAHAVRLIVMSPSIVRVSAVPGDALSLPESLMVVATPDNTPFETTQDGHELTLKTSALRAEVSLDTGAVQFFNLADQAVLSSDGSGSFSPVEVEGQPYFAVKQAFNHGTDEGLYGLGAHQQGQFNYNGEDVEMAQHNIVDVVPFLVSTRNYGILWDNNGISRFGDSKPYGALTEQLIVTGANGATGGLTGHYFRADQEFLTRTDADPNYQYLPADQFLRNPAPGSPLQAEFGANGPDRIVWEGQIEARAAGVHKFQLYASNYYKVIVDGHTVIDRWRQNWNPWYHNFELAMAPGEKHSLRVEWIPNDGYFRLLHQDPRPTADAHDVEFSSEVARGIDYYFVAGDDMDDVIAGYRHLTGPAVMLPRWAYGFWQSRQRYATQEELLGVVREYRRRQIPFDNIVEDWFYWPEDSWGSHEFDASRFPDPGGMIDSVHRQHAQFMISVWPKFYPTTANYKELDAGGHIYRRQIEMRSRDWVGPGYLNAFYDPYSPEARAIYYRQIHEKLGVLGVDAWWMDASEPDSHSNLDYNERALRMGPTAIGPGATVFNSYVLETARAIYEGERQTKPDVRTFQLTRSTWGGMQRYGAMDWSGDVAARWEDLALQVPAGINMSMSGMPNWTHDIGGFAVENRFSQAHPSAADQAEWRELYLRWFQFGAFSPVFRSHGEFPYRETYNIAPRGSAVYNSLIYYHRLRYRLLPYIYTLAGDTYQHSGTIMRGLVMDFPNDARVRDIGDQYMFGPSLLVAPVTSYQARTRATYLPAGTRWYDFYTGASFNGGQEMQAAAPLEHIPLFVRAGAIIPMGPAVQYALENPNGPLTVFVYRGANGAFSLYEDDGVSYQHQHGAFARIPFSYDDAAGTLTIGAREGSYPGMAQNRVINVRFIDGRSRNASNVDARPDRSVRYTGQAVTVRAR